MATLMELLPTPIHLRLLDRARQGLTTRMESWVPGRGTSLRHCGTTLLVLVGLSACAGTNNPVPVSAHDGLYVGTRLSNDPLACGIEAAGGKTSALVSDGQLSLNLFNAGTKLAGTVGEDGTLRASGLWRAPHSFIMITVLTGRISGSGLSGVATNQRCTTELNLTRQNPVGKRMPPPRSRSRASKRQ